MSVHSQENGVATKKKSKKTARRNVGSKGNESSIQTGSKRLTPDSDGNPNPWYSPTSTFGLGILWVVLMWCAFPPLGLWPLGWIATAPLLWLVQVKRLPSRKPYRQLLIVGFIYWLCTLYFIPIPHWALFFGWMTVSIYLAVYTPLFVFSARAMVHRMKIPLAIAAPIAWVGIEWLRCVVFTGQGMVCLSHTQYTQPMLIQVADLFGAYTVSFALVSVAACYVRFFFYRSVARVAGDARSAGGAGGARAETAHPRPPWIYALAGAAVFGCVAGYGYWKLKLLVETAASTPVNVAVIQGSVDTDLKQTRKVLEEKERQYTELTWQAREQNPEVDLIIWPEANLGFNDWLPETDYSRLTGELAEVTDQKIRASQEEMWRLFTGSRYRFPETVPFMVGTGCQDPSAKIIYNGAVLFDETGAVTDRYFKNHLVMFGEYTPLPSWFPFRDSLPISDTAAGKEASVFEVDGIRFAPSICFESTVPHLIRRHLNELAEVGNEPDVMVNLTNDGWFYGTSCLDFHLACNTFRAVEMRKPHLVCANTGISAEINSRGELIQLGPRRGTKILYCNVVESRSARGLYRKLGDWGSIFCAFLVAIGCCFGWLANAEPHSMDKQPGRTS